MDTYFLTATGLYELRHLIGVPLSVWSRAPQDTHGYWVGMKAG